jgi:uncharacterized protein (TIGR02145 family)
MKKFYAILCLAIASLTQLQAQAPQGFNYQATVRNSSGDLIVNTNVYFKFNVMQGSQTSLPVFTEIHYVPTDDLGQVNLVIGQGTATTGAFSELDWSLGSYYLGIELNTGNGYVAMGTTQLLSVPYALYAENSGNSTPTTPNLEAVLAENNSANNQQIKDLQDPTDAQDAVTKAYVDTEVLNNVQNIEQVLTQGNDANGLQLKGIADPTDAQDAVTKNYADNIISSFGYQQWSNNQVWNDNTTISPEPNSFWFINAENTTITLPPISNQGDVIKIYYMGAGINNTTETSNQWEGFYTNIDAQSNGVIIGYFGITEPYNEGFHYASNEIIPFKLVSGLNTFIQIGDYWMLGEAVPLPPYYVDNDNDGYNENQGDCDDANAQVNPGASEIEDGIDNDCDGDIDEGFDASGTVTDIDGNTYDYLTYGDQVWTVENAEMVTYRDGTEIPQVTDPTQWSNLTTGAWSYYNNDPTKPRLYNWYAVMGIHDTDPNTPNKEFAPEGWHVPSDAEWTTLENYLIANGYNYDGTTTENKIAKAMASTTGWISSTEPGVPGNNQSLNNSSGFNAFPEGFRNNVGSFYYEGNDAFFWSSTEFNTNSAWFRDLYYGVSFLSRSNNFKQYGFSVRFVRD